PPTSSPLFPYTTLFRSPREGWPTVMRAAVMRKHQLVVADLPLPAPGPGEVLVKTLACGICGSDLHALKHAEKFVEAGRRAGSRLDRKSTRLNSSHDQIS